MRMKRTSLALASVVALSTGTYFAMAPSAACCGDGAIAAQGAITAGATVTSAISAASGSIVTMLTRIDLTLSNGFGKLYSEMAKQTASQRVMEEGRITTDNEMYLTERAADALLDYQLSPRACYEKQAAGAVDSAGVTVANTVKDLNREFTQRTLHTTNTAAAVAQIYTDHADKFCSAQDAKLGRCSTAAAQDLQNADVNAGNLLSRDALTGDYLVGAQAFMRNVANPIPTQQIPVGWEKTEQGKAFIAGQLVEQGRASVAANSFSNMIAMRKVVPGLGTAAQLNVPDVSTQQLIKAQTDGRFLSANWYNMIAGMSMNNLLREQNKMQAFDLWLSQQRYAQLERIEAVLATDLAASVKRDSEARLAVARQAAARGKAD